MNELRRKIKCFIGTRKVRHLFTADYSFATVIIHPIGTVIAQKKDNPVDCLRSYGQKPQHRTVHNIYKPKNFVHRIQRVLNTFQ